MAGEKLNSKHVSKKKIYWSIIGAVFAIACIVLGAIGITFASFNETKDRTIDINFKNESINVDAVINPDKTNAYGDVTLLKLFKSSDEVQEVNLMTNAQVTIAQSTQTALKVRFKLGFEVYDNASVSSVSLKTILSYLNQNVDLSSVIATPYTGFKWARINSNDNYYYLVNSSNSVVTINSTLQDYTLKLINKQITYGGIESLKLNLSASDKELFDKLSFVVQLEVVPTSDNFSYASPTYTYGKVAIFESNGGSDVSAILTTNNSVVLPNVTLTGSALNGWYADSAFASFVGASGASITQADNIATYYAKYTKNKYTVTLNPNGGQVYGSTSNYVINNVSYGDSFLSSNALTYKNGHKFLGYYDANNNCYIDENGREVRAWDKNASATLTAKYSSPQMYDIVYLGLDDSCFFVYANASQTTPPIQYTYGTSELVIPTPAKPGYTFNGWYLNDDRTTLHNPFRVTNTTLGTIHLVASFTEVQYTASIDGVANSNVTFKRDTQPLVLPALSNSYVGYRVKSISNNWKPTSSSTQSYNAFTIGELYPGGLQISSRYGNVVFEKVESAQDAIVFDAQAGDAFVEPIAILRTTTAQVILPNAYRDGYIFGGWYYDTACTEANKAPRLYTVNLSKLAVSEYRLYAKWTPGTPSCVVNLHNDNGNDTTITYNIAPSRLAFAVAQTVNAPTKTGYTFTGYYTKEHGLGTKFYDANGSALMKELTSSYFTDYVYTFDLYATYSENVYKITFDSNGGDDISPIYYTASTDSVIYPKANKFGYTFSKWRVNTASGNWTVGDIASATNISTNGKYGHVTLTAVYTPITYTITMRTYALNGVTLTSKTNTITYTLESTSITIPTQTLAGHTFLGWEVNSGFGSWGNYNILQPSTITLNSMYYGDVELVAKFSVTVYQIQFQYRDSATNKVLTSYTYNRPKPSNPSELESVTVSYSSVAQPIYYTYHSKSVTLRSLVNNQGTKYTSWMPSVSYYGWNASSYASGQTVTLTASHFDSRNPIPIVLYSRVTTLFDGGDGSATHPYQVKTQVQLRNLSDVINDATLNSIYAPLHYVQTANITLSGSLGTRAYNGTNIAYNFNSIGYDVDGHRFSGNYNGQGYTIVSMCTVSDKLTASGLFGCVTGASIKNVIVQEPRIYSNYGFVSALVSRVNFNTIIENCHITSTSSATTSGGSTYAINSIGHVVGAIVGDGRGVYIKNCSNAVNIQSSGKQTGGIIGECYRNSVLVDVANYGDVRIYRNSPVTTNNWDCGGVVGKLGHHAISDKTAIGSCFAINLYNSGNVTVEANVNGSMAHGGVLGYKGFNSFVFNAYNDGIFKYYVGSSNNSGQSAVCGNYVSTDLNTQAGSSNGLTNLYYKQNTNVRVATDGTISYINSNSVKQYMLTESQIGGTDIINTNYEIFHTTSFASLATLMNVWMYDLQSQTELVNPKHYVAGEANPIIYADLISYLSALGIDREELHYWARSASSNATVTTSFGASRTQRGLSAYITDESRANSSLMLKYIDLCGGSLNGSYSRVYGKLIKNGTTVYADSENIAKADFVRPGFSFLGLNTRQDGTGTFLSLNASNQYEIAFTEQDSGLVTYYAIWQEAFAGGSGTEDDPYIIASGEQFAKMATLVNSGDAHYQSAVYHQPQNIHLENVSWTSVGTWTNPFKGTYYGYNTCIYFNTVNFSSLNNIGLFGVVSGSVIKNVRVQSNSTLTGGSNTGVLVGYAINNTLIDTCFVQGMTVQGDTCVGGMVGMADNSTIVNCHVRGVVTIGKKRVGGMVGYLVNSKLINFISGDITPVRATAPTTTDGCGGVVGNANGSTIANGYIAEYMQYGTNNEIAYTSTVGQYIGKIVGLCVTSKTTISNVYWQNQTNANYTQANNYPYVGSASTTANYQLTSVCNFTNTAPYKLSQFITINGHRACYLFEALNYYAEYIAPPSGATYSYSHIRNQFITYDNTTYSSQSRQVTYCLDLPSEVAIDSVTWTASSGYVSAVNITFAGVGVNLPNQIPKVKNNTHIFTGWYSADGKQLTSVTARDANGVPTTIVWIAGANVIYDNELFFAHWKKSDGSLTITGVNTEFNKGTAIELVTSSYENTGNSATDVHYSLGTQATASSGTTIPTASTVGTYTVYYYQSLNGNTYSGSVKSTITQRDLSSGAQIESIANQVYNGSAKTPAVTVKDFNKTYTISANDYTITYSNNVNVGEAIVTINGRNNYKGSISTSFAIVSAVNTVAVSAKTGLVYNNTNQALVTVANAKGTVYYSLSTVLNDKNYSTGQTTIPTGKNAGVYTVYWYCMPSSGYQNAVGSVSVTVDKRALSNVTISGVVNKIYTGAPQTQVYTVTDTALTGSPTLTLGTDFAQVYTNNTNAGTATLTLTGVGNYSGTKSATFTITQTADTIIVVGLTLTYTGSAQNMASVSQSGSNYTVYFGTVVLNSSNYSTSGSATIPKQTNAGTYTYYYYAVSNSGNYAPISGSIKTVINRADIAGVEITGIVNKNYTGIAQTQTPTVKYNGTTLTKDTHYILNYSNNVNASSNAIVTINGIGNFGGSKSITFTINKIANTCQVTAKTLSYTGEAQELLTYANNFGAVHFNFNASASTKSSTDIPTGVNALNYLVYWFCEGDDNHLSSSGNLTITISAKTDSVVITGAKGLVFNNTAQELVLGVTYGGSGTVHYNLNATATASSGTTIPTATNVGNYTVYVFIEASANYTSCSGSIVVNIASRDISNVVISDIADIVYTGSALKPALTVKDFNNTLTLTTASHYSVTYENNTNVGQATVTITGKGNYSGTKTANFNIVVQGNTVSISNVTGLIFNNANQDLIKVNNAGSGTLYYSVGVELTSANYLTEGTVYNESSSKPKGKDAGDYIVYYYSAGTESVSSAWGNVTTTIGKRNLSNVTISGLTSKVYTGGQITQTYTVKDFSNALTLLLNTDFTESYTNNVEVGNATLTIKATDGSNYVGTKTATFAIIKDANSVIVSPITGLVFNNTNQNLVTCTNAIGTMHYNLGASATSSSSSTIPVGKNAGSYTVYWLCDGNANHSSTSGKVVVTIAKRTLDRTNTTITGYSNVVYTGSAKTFTLTIKDSGLNYTLNQSSDVQVTYSNNINPGTATISVSVRSGSTNFTGTSPVTANFTITYAVITKSATLPNFTYNYDGSAHYGVDSQIKACYKTVNNQPITCTYNIRATGTYSTDMPGFTIVGTYTVYVKVSAPNHEDRAENDTFTVSIKKTTISTPAGLSWSGGTAKWNAITLPDGAYITYVVTLYKGTTVKQTITTTGSSTDFTSAMNQAGNDWKFTVKALTSTTNYDDSAVSSASATTTVYTVAYNANGGNTASLPSMQYKISGQSLTLTNRTPTFSYKTYMGWGTSTSATSASYYPNNIYTANANITLYAIWHVTVTFSYSGSCTKDYHEDGVARYSTTQLTSYDDVMNAEQCPGLTISGSTVSGSYTFEWYWTGSTASKVYYLYLGNVNRKNGWTDDWFGHNTAIVIPSMTYGLSLSKNLKTIGNDSKNWSDYDVTRYYFHTYKLTISGNGSVSITVGSY